jgi:hypothetical protein
MRDKPILSSEKMLHKDYKRKGSIAKKNSGREPQGAWRQVKLIGSKPPVVKELWHRVESIESCNCEKWEAGIWGQGQFGNPPLEAVTKQRLVKTDKTLCVL